MPEIRPVSDLRNNFGEISRIVHEKREPVFLTKNGRGDMVVMSIAYYDELQYHNEVFTKLKEAELEARASGVRYDHAEVFERLRGQLSDAKEP